MSSKFLFGFTYFIISSFFNFKSEAVDFKIRSEAHVCHDVDFMDLRKIPIVQPVGLISYPGSGNTWVRHLLQMATGILTGTIYNEKAFQIKTGSNFPYLGNVAKNLWLVIKDHMFPDAR